MNDKQLNQYNMYMRVLKVLDTHNAVWNKNTKITANYQQFVEKTNAIGTLQIQQEANTSGITKDKVILKEKLIELTVRVLKGVQSYAADNSDNALAANVDYNKSKLLRLRENALTSTCEMIHKKVSTYVQNLKEYGITTALLADLEATNTAFKKIIPDPQLAIGTSKLVTEKLSGLFSATNGLLSKQLDGKIEQYKATNNEFYNAYFNARNIIERSRSAKPEVEPVVG